MGAHWLHWKVKSSLWALAVSQGGLSAFGIYMFSLCPGISLYLPVIWLFRMVSAFGIYMFALFTGSSWYLHIIWLFHMDAHWLYLKDRAHSVLWQFWMGGPSAFGIYMFSLCTGISWYLPIIWLFWMGTHWWHWAPQSWLSALAVSYGGRGDYQEGG